MRTIVTSWALRSFLCAMGAAGMVRAADPTLVGHWQLDGDTRDASGNNRHGTLGGNPQFVPGVYGEALEFDGDDSLTITGYKGIEGTNPFSVAAWIKTKSTDTKTIVTWGSAVSGAKIELRIINNVLRANHGAGNVNSASAVNDDQWHHVALTVTANATLSYPQMILYVDGRDDTVPSTDPDPVLNIVPAFDVGIGWRSTDSDRYWEGRIDDVRIYNRVLTAAEVKALAVHPKAYAPSPADGTLDVGSPLLTWKPRETASSHNVYLGTDPNLGPAYLVAPRLMVALYWYVPGLTPGTIYYWRVDELDPDGTVHAGDVWSFIVQALTAYYPSPADGANDAAPTPRLTWLPGQSATRHHLYFGDSNDAVSQGAAGTDKGELKDPNFAPGVLESLTTYYWRVDELAVGGTVRTGPVWTFTTCLSVDDFESYTDDVAAKTTIYDTWIDGVTNGLSGSTVGNINAPFAEQRIVHGGKQAMPLDYNNVNSPFYSEAEREFAPTQDWTARGADTLVLHIRGALGNQAAPFYVALEDAARHSATVAHPDPALATTTRWTAWKIPLSQFTGVNVAKVKKLYLGVGDRKTPAAGGAGRIYIDDVCVTKP
jgi:hypothetical protein